MIAQETLMRGVSRTLPSPSPNGEQRKRRVKLNFLKKVYVAR